MAIPIAVCGRTASIFEAINELLPATYEGRAFPSSILRSFRWSNFSEIVVSGHTSTETAASELPLLLRGSKVVPSSGYGTNVTNDESKIPVAVVVGGAFPQSDFEQIIQECNAVRPLAFFRADVSKHPAGGGPPPVQMLVDRVVKAMEEAAAGKGAGAWEPGVYLY